MEVGLIGVGLMGHGIAKNLLRSGYKLTLLEHAGNQPVDDLLELGAETLASPAELVRRNDVIFLCVTGSPQLEDVMFQADGVLAGLGEGKTVVDCSTVEPHITLKVADAVFGKDARFLDAPLTRTPKEAEQGRLNVMVGGSEQTLSEIRPLLDTFAENIYHAGPVGAGHTLKLLHNFVSLGNCALLAEAVVCARRGGVNINTFIDVLASGGGDSIALKRLTPYIRGGDEGGFRFSLSNCHKDLSYYTSMAYQQHVPATVAQAIQHVFELAKAKGGDRPVPQLIDFLDAIESSDDE
jgi:3-hydroxyisobutyrate dehydrogenase